MDRLQGFERMGRVSGEDARQHFLDEITAKMTEIVGEFSMQRGNGYQAGDKLKRLMELREKVRQLPSDTDGYVVEFSNVKHGSSVKITPDYIYSGEVSEKGKILACITLITQVMVNKFLCQKGCCSVPTDQETFFYRGRRLRLRHQRKVNTNPAQSLICPKRGSGLWEKCIIRSLFIS